MDTFRPTPVHVRIVAGQPVECEYTLAKPGPVVNWKSHGSGVVYEPARPITTRSRRWKRLQLEHIARQLHAPHHMRSEAEVSRLIKR